MQRRQLSVMESRRPVRNATLRYSTLLYATLRYSTLRYSTRAPALGLTLHGGPEATGGQSFLDVCRNLSSPWFGR